MPPVGSSVTTVQYLPKTKSYSSAAMLSDYRTVTPTHTELEVYIHIYVVSVVVALEKYLYELFVVRTMQKYNETYMTWSLHMSSLFGRCNPRGPDEALPKLAVDKPISATSLFE